MYNKKLIIISFIFSSFCLLASEGYIRSYRCGDFDWSAAELDASFAEKFSRNIPLMMESFAMRRHVASEVCNAFTKFNALPEEYRKLRQDDIRQLQSALAVLKDLERAAHTHQAHVFFMGKGNKF